MAKKDTYVHEMDWTKKLGGFYLDNYRRYQYNLIAPYIGKTVLEVGSGDRSFTKLLVSKSHTIQTLLSIEPSPVLFRSFQNDRYPSYVKFQKIDLFDMKKHDFLAFDTILFIHVLEHIKHDADALRHSHTLLAPHGRVLIEVPALPFLFSEHDVSLGHFRRYTKAMIYALIDRKLYDIEDVWYQDPFGVIGSLIFFKWKKITLKSDTGAQLVGSKGRFYDSYLIPLEQYIERYIRFPFGLSLTAVLKKR